MAFWLKRREGEEKEGINKRVFVVRGMTIRIKRRERQDKVGTDKWMGNCREMRGGKSKAIEIKGRWMTIRVKGRRRQGKEEGNDKEVNVI